MSFVDRVTGFLVAGGTLLTLQDPLWYSRLPKAAHALNRGGYYLWRVGQGNVKQTGEPLCCRSQTSSTLGPSSRQADPTGPGNRPDVVGARLSL